MMFSCFGQRMPRIGREFREEWENAIKKLFNMDLRTENSPAICSLHFEPECIYFKKVKDQIELKLKRGALPTIGTKSVVRV